MDIRTVNHPSDRYTIDVYTHSRMAPWELLLQKSTQLEVNQAADVATNLAALAAIGKETRKRNVYVSTRTIGRVQKHPGLRIERITVYNDKRILLTVTESITVKVKEYERQPPEPA